MAWKIEHDDTTYAIHQSGTTARWVFIGLAVLAAAISLDWMLPPSNRSLVVELFPVVMWIPVAYAASPLTTTIEARFDRAAGRLTVEGSRWFRKSWSVDVPLSEVEGIDTSAEKYGSAVASAANFLRVRLRDGRTPVIWFPAETALVGLRQTELNAWLARV